MEKRELPAYMFYNSEQLVTAIEAEERKLKGLLRGLPTAVQIAIQECVDMLRNLDAAADEEART